MNLVATGAIALFLAAITGSQVAGQTLAPTPSNTSSEASQLQLLAKKIDEQNAKIDMLSQQILKLQLELANERPGVMIGEATPTGSAAASATAQPPAKNGNGNTHIVARGETLTSIAKMHGVSVGDLQKSNHIDNPLKLQAGQTLVIPTPTPAAIPTSPVE